MNATLRYLAGLLFTVAAVFVLNTSTLADAHASSDAWPTQYLELSYDGTVLTIHGTGEDDDIVITPAPDGGLLVSQAGFPEEVHFAEGAVRAIEVLGGGGDDYVFNRTTIELVTFTGGGEDMLQCPQGTDCAMEIGEGTLIVAGE